MKQVTRSWNATNGVRSRHVRVWRFIIIATLALATFGFSTFGQINSANAGWSIADRATETYGKAKRVSRKRKYKSSTRRKKYASRKNSGSRSKYRANKSKWKKKKRYTAKKRRKYKKTKTAKRSSKNYSSKVRKKGNVRWVASSSCLNSRLRAIVYEVASRYGSVTVSSTCRSRSRNRRVGGAKRSRHLTGNAVDFRVHGRYGAAYSYLKSHSGVGGYKHYGGGLFHIDTGPRRTW